LPVIHKENKNQRLLPKQVIRIILSCYLFWYESFEMTNQNYPFVPEEPGGQQIEQDCAIKPGTESENIHSGKKLVN